MEDWNEIFEISRNWKIHRKETANEIIHRDLLYGMNKEGVLRILGQEKNVYEKECWVYPIESSWWLKRDYFLGIYFVENKVFQSKRFQFQRRKILELDGEALL